MPNWTTHLGGGYLIARPAAKKDLRLFLLGTILPDLVARLEAITMDLLHLDVFTRYEVDAFHTPFMLFLVALLIALFSDKPKRCWALISAGGLIHFFMDMLETKMNHFGTLVFFPFSYQSFQFNLFPRAGFWVYFVWVICLLTLLYAVFEKKENIIHRQEPIWWKIILLATLLFLLPFWAKPNYYAHNVDFIRFARNPGEFEGKAVSLYTAEIMSEDPIIVREVFNYFELVTEQRFKTGDWISLDGIYRKGKIYPRHIQAEMGAKLKSLLSLPGLFLFPFLWWDWRNLAFLAKFRKSELDLNR